MFFLRSSPPPISTLFPYTTLFRSRRDFREDQRDQVRRFIELYHRLLTWLMVGTGAIQIVPATLQIISQDRKSTRLNSSHRSMSHIVLCVKNKYTLAEIFASCCFIF